MGNQAVKGLKEEPPAPTVVKSDAEWRAVLPPATYEVARQAGTEPAWSGKYNKSKKEGVYTCICCHSDLFASSAKFDSGTGWPSYFQVRAI